jgi:hypothetical protein
VEGLKAWPDVGREWRIGSRRERLVQVILLRLGLRRIRAKSRSLTPEGVRDDNVFNLRDVERAWCWSQGKFDVASVED